MECHRPSVLTESLHASVFSFRIRSINQIVIFVLESHFPLFSSYRTENYKDENSTDKSINTIDRNCKRASNEAQNHMIAVNSWRIIKSDKVKTRKICVASMIASRPYKT